MTAKMTRNILLMLVATVLMGIVLNLYIHNTGTVPAADNAAPLTDGSYTSSAQGCLSEVTVTVTVTGGKVTVDGIDVREMSQAQLHDLLGYVPQKGVLFSGTIDSNLKFGGEDITDAQVHKAAAIAQATDFIEAKSESYQSPIAQGGSNVSGGQKQRLSIARAIAKNPKVYLFDDSFSALDYKTDVTLRRALKAQTDNATVIIVAQRISTVLHANQILVLDEGRLVGKGTHAQLMASCPEYQEIARSQLSQKSGNTYFNKVLTRRSYFSPVYICAIPKLWERALQSLNPASRIIAIKHSGAGNSSTEAGRYSYALRSLEIIPPIAGNRRWL